MEGRPGEEIDRLGRLKQDLFLRGKGETEAGRLTLAEDEGTRGQGAGQGRNRALCREHIRILSTHGDQGCEDLRRELHAALPAAWRFRQKPTEWVGGAVAWESREWGPRIAMRESDEWAPNPSQEEESDKDLVTMWRRWRMPAQPRMPAMRRGLPRHFAGSRPIARTMGACPSQFEESVFLPQ